MDVLYKKSKLCGKLIVIANAMLFVGTIKLSKSGGFFKGLRVIIDNVDKKLLIIYAIGFMSCGACY